MLCSNTYIRMLDRSTLALIEYVPHSYSINPIVVITRSLVQKPVDASAHVISTQIMWKTQKLFSIGKRCHWLRTRSPIQHF